MNGVALSASSPTKAATAAPGGLSLADIYACREALEMGYNTSDCPEVRWGATAGSAEAATCDRHAPCEQRACMETYQDWFRDARRRPREASPHIPRVRSERPGRASSRLPMRGIGDPHTKCVDRWMRQVRRAALCATSQAPRSSARLIGPGHSEPGPPQPLQQARFHGGPSRTLDRARDRLIKEVVKMLCGGLIHGDLSEYNVLVDAHGLVIIDLPQAIDASGNNNAARMLERDVGNVTAYFGRFAPELLATSYDKQIWYIYESGRLTPAVTLTGHFKGTNKQADVDSIPREIEDAREDAVRRRH